MVIPTCFLFTPACEEKVLDRLVAWSQVPHTSVTAVPLVDCKANSATISKTVRLHGAQLSEVAAQVEELAWAKPLCTVHTALLAVVEGKGEKENGQLEKDDLGLLGRLRKDVGNIGATEKEELESFSTSSTHSDEQKRKLLQVKTIET